MQPFVSLSLDMQACFNIALKIFSLRREYKARLYGNIDQSMFSKARSKERTRLANGQNVFLKCYVSFYNMELTNKENNKRSISIIIEDWLNFKMFQSCFIIFHKYLIRQENELAGVKTNGPHRHKVYPTEVGVTSNRLFIKQTIKYWRNRWNTLVMCVLGSLGGL